MSLFNVPDDAPDADVRPEFGGELAAAGVRFGGAALQGVADRSFPARVAVLMRSRPLAEAVAAAERQDWPADTYDVATFALAAIDLVISRQGFEEEATFRDVVDGLAGLAARAAADRPHGEHVQVAEFTVNALLNRANREAEFTYRISDYTGDGRGHRQREVRFRLLVEREDPIRGEVVLNATRDAINALIGGLEFDVEDEQVANEILLERQLAKGAFDAAERSAVRARLLSVSLADDLDRVLKATQRDLRTVLAEWATTIPVRLDEARDHIQQRLDAEHRLHLKIGESLDAADDAVAESAGRIAGLLSECQRRHESLHRRVIQARGVFLYEQDRQSFRPPAQMYRPDLNAEVLGPLLAADQGTAETVTGQWVSDVAGPRAPRLPRLYRLIGDLWVVRDDADTEAASADEMDLAAPDRPVLGPRVLAAAARAVQLTGLPARLSAVIATCLTHPHLLAEDGPARASAATTDVDAADFDGADRLQAAATVALAALWCFAPEDLDDGATVQDLSVVVLGPRAAVDTDGTPLLLTGWAGDDLILAPFADALADADPPPVTALPAGAPA